MGSICRIGYAIIRCNDSQLKTLPITTEVPFGDSRDAEADESEYLAKHQNPDMLADLYWFYGSCMNDYKASMKGIYSTSICKTAIDEASGAKSPLKTLSAHLRSCRDHQHLETNLQLQ